MAAWMSSSWVSVLISWMACRSGVWVAGYIHTCSSIVLEHNTHLLGCADSAQDQNAPSGPESVAQLPGCWADTTCSNAAQHSCACASSDGGT
jgi:hypothetical protein